MRDKEITMKHRMRRIAVVLVAAVALAGVVAYTPASGQASGEAAPISGVTIPPGYRDWRLISVAREEGDLDDLRAILGNDIAIKAYREATRPFPGRHHHFPACLELRLVGGKQQSLWPSSIFRGRPPKNGVQFMVTKSRGFLTGGSSGASRQTGFRSRVSLS
jgi:hypothetical protein